MNPEHCLVEREGHILIVTLNRPEAKNALSSGMLAGMYRAWRMLDEDPELRVAILTGRGDVFCAGADLGQRDRAWRVDWNDDHHHQYMVDILADLDSSQGTRQFKVMVHMGNYALWLVGVFPDYVAARRLRKGGPDVDYYERLGQHGYQLASDHALADQLGMEPILRSAADRFSQVRRALNRLSDRCLFPDRFSPDRVLRELEDPA